MSSQIGEAVSFISGAKRSQRMLPFWMIPRDALTEIAKRYQAGQDKGYGPNNWMKALHSTDVEFVRQFADHISTHEANFLLHVGDGSLDADGETPLQNAAAAAWGWIALITYLLRDPSLVAHAFPKESPFDKEGKYKG